MKCRVCGISNSTSYASATLLNRSVMYFECLNCSYLQTETPYWLKEAYKSSINASDTGILDRNLKNLDLVLTTLALIGERDPKVVDYAGGFGILVRLLRDKGVDAFWADPYSQNLLARGFEFKGGIKASLVTAFEAFEHFVHPTKEMENLLQISPNILLTTTLAPTPAPKPTDWWYYGLDHGQHIGFYRVATLRYLADKFGMNLLTDGVSIHLLSKKRFPGLQWHTLRWLYRMFPSVFSMRFKSKTWSDHLYITK